jgi:uncharacterized protein YdeI (YjbR/CyaY-like superfamily)
MNPLIDHYLEAGCGRCPLGGTSSCKVHSWTKELEKLRSIVLDCGLSEELKWGVPCYTFQGKNVLMVSAFKGYCALSFFKGALLNNSRKILTAPGKNSQSARVIRFTGLDEIVKLEQTLKALIFESIEVEKAGLKVEFKKNPEPVPDELQKRLDEDSFFKSAFEGLSPGRQRGYILYFSQPKQSKTRFERIEKCIPKILNGEGLNDRYKSGKKN